MALQKPSALLELLATDEGYMMRMWRWDQSPPPVPYRDLDATIPPASFRMDRIAAGKVDLAAQLADFIAVTFDNSIPKLEGDDIVTP